MTEAVLELYCIESHPNPAMARLNGKPLSLSPLQLALLGALARRHGSPVHRDRLLRDLVLTPASLYKLVYTTRKKLGDQAEQLEQVGRCTTRKGKTLGFSGYQLNFAEILWHRSTIIPEAS